MQRWKKISEKVLLAHPRLSVVEDTVELPSGTHTKYIWLDGTPDAAEVIALNKDGKVLVQKEYSYPPNEFLFQFPGGKIDHGESPEQGAARELAEESSVKGELTCMGWFYVDNRRKKSKFYVYLSRNSQLIKSIPQDEEEDFEHFWFTPEEIDKMIIEGQIVTYSFLAAWALFKAHLTQ